MIYRNVEDLLSEDGELNIQTLSSCINEHKVEANKLKTIEKYYNMSFSKQEALIYDQQTGKPINNNTKNIRVNFAKEITDLITSYVFGKPISYVGGNSDNLIDWFSEIDEDSHNIKLAKMQSIFGKAFELIYLDELDDEPNVFMPFLAELSPINTFVVKDTDIRHKTILGCTYREKINYDGKFIGYIATVYTDKYVYTLEGSNISCLSITDIEEHYFGGVPLIQLNNNEEEKGDYEDVTSLIDAYEDLQHNRVKDKEQFINRLLVITNSSLGDDEETYIQSCNTLKNGGILELESSSEKPSDAKFISQQFDESSVEVLSKRINEDIHRISKTPNLVDEEFSGNSSGVALQYKLFGTEELGVIKERYFKKLLKKRLRLINNVMTLKNNKDYVVDLKELSIQMKRNLPVSLDEKIKELQGTQDILSLRTRLHRYDEDLNVEDEINQLMKEKKEQANIMSNAFDPYNFPKEDTVLNRDGTNVNTDDNKDEDKQ